MSQILNAKIIKAHDGRQIEKEPFRLSILCPVRALALTERQQNRKGLHVRSLPLAIHAEQRLLISDVKFSVRIMELRRFLCILFSRLLI